MTGQGALVKKKKSQEKRVVLMFGTSTIIVLTEPFRKITFIRFVALQNHRLA